MAVLIQKGTLPTLEQLDDVGKFVVVNSAGTNYELQAAAVDGIGIIPRLGDWAVSDAPTAGVRATASKTAVAGSRHIATAISFSVITTTTAPTVATLTISLRDGASDTGTVFMVWRVRVSAAMTDQNVAQVVLSGLNVVGTDNTAMTLEFDAGDINTLEDVSLTGYSVPVAA